MKRLATVALALAAPALASASPVLHVARDPDPSHPLLWTVGIAAWLAVFGGPLVIGAAAEAVLALRRVRARPAGRR